MRNFLTASVPPVEAPTKMILLPAVTARAVRPGTGIVVAISARSAREFVDGLALRVEQVRGVQEAFRVSGEEQTVLAH